MRMLARKTNRSLIFRELESYETRFYSVPLETKPRPLYRERGLVSMPMMRMPYSQNSGANRSLNATQASTLPVCTTAFSSSEDNDLLSAPLLGHWKRYYQTLCLQAGSNVSSVEWAESRIVLKLEQILYAFELTAGIGTLHKGDDISLGV